MTNISGVLKLSRKLLAEQEKKLIQAKQYVLGFAFNEIRESVVLIEKNRPEWQAGKHNGIGGKIEEFDETPLDAMIREFKEETGCETTEADWHYFAVINCEADILNGQPAQIHCFRCFLHHDRFRECITQETEKVVRVSAGVTIYMMKLIDKVRFLIPLALEKYLNFVTINFDK